jgi:DNA-binding CsgD family transcriptional regulator
VTVVRVGAEVIGRDDELAILDDFLAQREGLPRALVLEGEAGIGKTALWRAALEAAEAASYTVLAARPSESETKIAYAVLRDLISASFVEVSSQLPAPQRRALEVALLMADPVGDAPDPGAIGVATISTLHELATRGPLVVALDDAQWMDAPSASALTFAARRLEELPVALLLAVRSPDPGAVPHALARALPDERVRRERVGPLSLGAIQALLRLRLELTLSRPVLTRLCQISGGNPFVALELGRALKRRGSDVAHARELPVPTLLRELVEERLSALPGVTRDVLVHAAVLAQPSVALLEDALGDEAESRLGPAVEAQVIELDAGRVAFSHPLLASVLVSTLAARERRRVHRRLAEVVRDPEERARHLSLAAERPDAAVADALDSAGGLARSRGAPDAAAELFEQARRLTPTDRHEDRRQRTVRAAECHFEAGETQRAEVLLEEALASSPSGRQRAEVLLRLAWVRGHADNLALADGLAQALNEAEGETGVRAEIENALAWASHMSGDLAAAARHARSALDLAEESGEAMTLAPLLANVALLEFLRGGGVDRAVLDRALALEANSADMGGTIGPSWILATLCLWTGELDGARTTLNALQRRATETGDERAIPLILDCLGRVAWAEGDWPRAERYAAEAIAAALRNAHETERTFALATKALLAAHRGSVDVARATIDEGLALADQTGMRPAGFEFRAISGFLELSLGDLAAAEAQLTPLRRDLAAGGFHEPAAVGFRFHPNLIEALVGLGRLDEAEQLLEEFEEAARRLDRPWALATGARCRALLCSTRADLAGAHVALDEARRAHERVGEPFELARTLLAQGLVERRARRRAAARESLEAALALFEGLGARLWDGRARAELGRVGGRAPASEGELTATERRVAELVAEGRSNKEVAALLFVTVKTVERNLTRVYEKLGVRSRTQLASRLAAARE